MQPDTFRALFRPAVLLLLAACGSAQAADAQPFTTDVFVGGSGGYHSYRIPALIASSKGTLLAFCEGRKSNLSDHGDLDLMLRRSSDGGKTWQPMQLVYEEGGTEKVTIGNPCPVVDRSTGRIWLPFCRDNDDVLMTYSDDDGATWAAPQEITADVKKPGWGWYATGPGVGIQLSSGQHKGRLVIPCDHSQQIDGRRVQFSHVFYSDDGGENWKLGGSADRYTDECQVVELTDGALLLNMRNYWGSEGKRPQRGKMRAIAISRDGGATWADLRFDESLIEPICQASLIAYPLDGKDSARLLLFSNPASKSKRHRLTVRLSRDEGKTWTASRLLDAGPTAYSCLTRLGDGAIGCLYEAGEKHAYEKLIFTRFPLEWLESTGESSR